MGTLDAVTELTKRLSWQLEWLKARAGEPTDVTLLHLKELKADLSRGSELLQRVQSETETQDSARVVSGYIQCLERIKEALPILEGQLLTRRAHLEPERTHVQAAAAWLQRSKDTL